jgi:hypothetical protein
MMDYSLSTGALYGIPLFTFMDLLMSSKNGKQAFIKKKPAVAP